MQSADETARLPSTDKLNVSNPISPGSDAPFWQGKRLRRRGVWAEIRRWAVAFAIFTILGIGLLGASLFLAIYRDARLNQTRRVDAILLLGAAQYNGKPSPVLLARLQETLAAYQEGASPWIVVTGGKMEGDQFTEAETSRNYLIAHGVPEDRILMENEGRDSWSSLQGAAVVMRQHGFKSVLLVSDGFHLFRVKLMARELGFQAFGRAAMKSPIRPNSQTEINYLVRETGGVLVFLWNQKL